MPTLYIAGDSYAALSKTQPIGSSWSELLASHLKYELTNISRIGASNETICIQLDYITEVIAPDDFVICVLTDSFRKTLPLTTKDLTDKHLLEYHSLHENQNFIGNIVFQGQAQAQLEPYTHLNCKKSKDAELYFKTFYNYTYQKWYETTLITGALSKLKNKTSRFVLFLGGFDDRVYLDNEYPVTNQTFCIEEEKFSKLSSNDWFKLHRDPKSANHISLLGHQKIFRNIVKFFTI